MGIFDYTYWNNMLEGEDGTGENTGLYADYLSQFPSERIESTTEYYDTSIDAGLAGYFPNIDQDE